MNQNDINRIVQAVLEELRKMDEQQKQKALLIYTGAAIGFDEALSSICRLRQEGYSFDVYYTRGAEAALDMSVVRAHAEPERFVCDLGDEAPEAFVAQYDTVIVPALTINTAAKVSHCIMDNPASRMISSALMKGKKVVVANDGCCPDHPVREALGFKIAEPMKAQMRSNLVKVRDFGAIVTSAAELADAVLGLEPKKEEKKLAAPKQTQSEKKAGGAKKPKSKRPLITRKDVDSCPTGGVLRIPKNSNVTALVWDLARERGITIVKE